MLASKALPILLVYLLFWKAAANTADITIPSFTRMIDPA